MTDIMAEEYKEEHPESLERDPNARMAFASGFTSYKSDSIDYLLEHNDQLPLTIVLFYDHGVHDEDLMRVFAIKLADAFIFKNEKRFKKANGMTSELTKSYCEEFEAAMPVVIENVSCVSNPVGGGRLCKVPFY